MLLNVLLVGFQPIDASLTKSVAGIAENPETVQEIVNHHWLEHI